MRPVMAVISARRADRVAESSSEGCIVIGQNRCGARAFDIRSMTVIRRGGDVAGRGSAIYGQDDVRIGQGTLGSPEMPLQPAHQLGVGEAEFGIGALGVAGQRLHQPLQFLAQVGIEIGEQLTDDLGVDGA